MLTRLALWLAFGAAVVFPRLEAAGAEPAAAGRQTLKIPMADGVALATDVYLPEGPGPFPCVLVRTPYSKDAIGGLGTDGAKRGYAMVVQDTRGRFASEGDNLPFEADGWDGHADGSDTAAWLVRQPWCNGRIGTWGGSAVGITQLMLAGSGVRTIACQHITVGAPSLYHDAVFPGGVFKKAMIEDWLRISKFSSNALTLWTSHPVHDAYWRERELHRRYGRVNPAAVHIGGWFDIFAQGTLNAFQGYQERGAKSARGRQWLVMGPWTHGVLQDKAGELTFPGTKRPPGGVHDAWRWFEFQLKGVSNGFERAPAVTYYVMGDVRDTNAPGNCWRTARQWPPVPTRATRYYLQADRSLGATPPGSTAGLSFVADPGKPVPTVGGPQLTLPAGPMDQQTVESRPDVLVFTTAALEAPVEITGRVRLRLWVTSTCADTDFFGKFCDVYPDGHSYNICEGQLRARFRRGFDRENLLQAGNTYPLDLDLGSTSIVFNRGHCLRAQVTSSSAPGYDVNPNTGAPFRADTRTLTATNTLFVDARRPSHLLLPVATAAATR